MWGAVRETTGKWEKTAGKAGKYTLRINYQN